MSRPVAAMNARNSSTVTGLVEMANGLPTKTQCGGLSNAEELPSVRFDPCLNRPAGTMVRAGHVGQSRMTVPGCGAAAATTAGTFSGSGAWWAMIQATTASTASAAPSQANRATAAAGVRRRDPNRGTSENCAAGLDLGSGYGAASSTSIRAVV